MKKIFLFQILIGIALLNSCNNDRLKVDVSQVEVKLNTIHVDENFLPLDTLDLSKSKKALISSSGKFANFYLDTILQAGNLSNPNTLKILASDPTYPLALQVQENINLLGDEISNELEKLEDGFKHLKYYFPKAQIPEVALYNSWFQYGTLSYENYLGVGLDFFIQDTAILKLYPPQFYNYLKADMKPEYIANNAMYAHIVNVVYPGTGNENSLLDEMILKGKQRYLLEAMFPDFEERIIMNYTEEELAWCYQKELAVWRELSKIRDDQSTGLFSTKKNEINRWLMPGPFTASLSENATDRMGEWIGLQMIRDYLRQNPEISVVQMLGKRPEQIMKYYNPKK